MVELNTAVSLALQHDHLMSKRGILGLKPPASLKGDSNSLRRNHSSATIVRRYAILPSEEYGREFRHAQVIRQPYLPPVSQMHFLLWQTDAFSMPRQK
jgi:hypothetical protein